MVQIHFLLGQKYNNLITIANNDKLFLQTPSASFSHFPVTAHSSPCLSVSALSWTESGLTGPDPLLTWG